MAQPSLTPTRVVELGSGDIQITLSWNTIDDLDLWVIDPNGEKIYYQVPQSSSGGQLDIDANPGCQQLTTQPVENIYWPPDLAPTGTYRVLVNYYQQCGLNQSIPFTVQVIVDGNLTEFQGVMVEEGDVQEITTIQQ